MRWRLCIFLLSITAAFCFVLLTAVTDHGAGSSSRPPLISAARAGLAGLSEALQISRESDAVESHAPVAFAPQPFDPGLRPLSPQLFVPRGSDPVAERQERERSSRLQRTAPHQRLRLDENGWHREELALVTAYCPCAKCCGTGSPGITSIGKNAWSTGLAADPIYLGYGTEVFVPGYGLSVIDDTGGAMRRHWRRNGVLHIDVRMTYHYEARQWGKQYLAVKIYEED